MAEIEKVVIVATDGPSRIAKPRIVERSKRRLLLWEEARLHLLGDRQVVRDLTPSLQPRRIRTALRLKSTRRLVDLNKREMVPSKRAYRASPLRQEGSIGGSLKRTPCFDHSSNIARTSSVRKPSPVFWPMRWDSTNPSGGTTSAMPGRPVGGVTMIQRPSPGVSRPQPPGNRAGERKTAGFAPDLEPTPWQNSAGEKAGRALLPKGHAQCPLDRAAPSFA
jgi:hypothetical protein